MEADFFLLLLLLIFLNAHYLINNKAYYSTSYCVIRPLGSNGSSHFRKIISSNGVKVKDSGAMPPGTAGNKRNHSENDQIHLTKHRAEMKVEMPQVEVRRHIYRLEEREDSENRG